MRFFHPILKMVLSFWTALLLQSCSSISDYSDTVMSFVPGMDYIYCPTTTIKIYSNRCTNYGAPFYVLIKETDFQSYHGDSYPKIANLIAMPPEDESCFITRCIVPGQDEIIELETPEGMALGIYFLFTCPGEVWKQPLELHQDYSTIKITLGRNEIIAVSQ